MSSEGGGAQTTKTWKAYGNNGRNIFCGGEFCSDAGKQSRDEGSEGREMRSMLNSRKGGLMKVVCGLHEMDGSSTGLGLFRRGNTNLLCLLVPLILQD